MRRRTRTSKKTREKILPNLLFFGYIYLYFAKKQAKDKKNSKFAFLGTSTFLVKKVFPHRDSQILPNLLLGVDEKNKRRTRTREGQKKLPNLLFLDTSTFVVMRRRTRTSKKTREKNIAKFTLFGYVYLYLSPPPCSRSV